MTNNLILAISSGFKLNSNLKKTFPVLETTVVDFKEKNEIK